MSERIPSSGTDRAPSPEAPDDDLDERFRALMEGLRTTLPGTTVLLGFLLVLPFQSEGALAEVPTWLYALAFTSTAMASVLLIAPAVHQRVRAPMSGIARRSAHDVASAVRVAIVGTGFLAAAIVSSAALVSMALDGSIPMIVGAVLIGATIAYTWAYQPLVLFDRARRRRAEADHDEGHG